MRRVQQSLRELVNDIAKMGNIVFCVQSTPLNINMGKVNTPPIFQHPWTQSFMDKFEQDLNTWKFKSSCNSKIFFCIFYVQIKWCSL